ncbi:MAG: SBBP repeat-containing protein [Bryobacteraceae bacterium]
MFWSFRFGVVLCAALTLAAAPPEAAITQAKATLAQTPLRFEANQGQWDPAVLYAARSGGYELMFTPHGPALTLAGSHRVDIELLNSNPAPAIEAIGKLPTRTNYFIGAREHWHTNIASYSRVRYGAVYPGVDVVYYGRQDQLEFDFVLQPGADPHAIRLRFQGARHLSLTSEGDLAFEFGNGRMVQKKPLIYQEDPVTSTRREIPGRYVRLARNVVGLRVDGYDRKRPLVIDPTLVYCSYLGGSGADQINTVQVDSQGHLYVAGTTTTGDLLATNDAYSTTFASVTSIFVAIIDITPGSGYPLLYFTYLGGGGVDIPLSMAVDSQENVYLTGTTTSTGFPITVNAVQTTGGGSVVAAFVCELNPFGEAGAVSLVYSTFLGGTTGDSTGNGIAVDRKGLIYVIGATKATDFPLTTNAYQSVTWGAQDAFLCQIDPNAGVLDYSTYLGGELADQGRALALAPNGLVYFAVTTESTEFPMAGLAYNYNLTAPIGIVIGVMDLTQVGANSLVYATYFGGSDIQEVRGIALDAAGNLLVTGYTLATDFPVTPDAAQPKPGGNCDAFVSVVNPFGFSKFLVYSTYLGGSQGEVAYGIAGDSAGNIYVTGYTLSPDFPTTGDAFEPNWGGGIDLFLTKLKPGIPGPAGFESSTYIGGRGVYSPTALTLGRDGTIYVVGLGGSGLPSTADALQGYGGGLSDGFIMVLGK